MDLGVHMLSIIFSSAKTWTAWTQLSGKHLISINLFYTMGASQRFLSHWTWPVSWLGKTGKTIIVDAVSNRKLTSIFLNKPFRILHAVILLSSTCAHVCLRNIVQHNERRLKTKGLTCLDTLYFLNFIGVRILKGAMKLQYLLEKA
jgi:hypothetical protein